MAVEPLAPINGDDPVELAFGLLTEADANTIRVWLAAGGSLADLATTATNAPRSAYTQTFSTADKTHAARTATAVASADATDLATAITLVNEIKVAVNALRADLADTAGVVNAVVDDLQSLGLVG